MTKVILILSKSFTNMSKMPLRSFYIINHLSVFTNQKLKVANVTLLLFLFGRE